MQSVNWYVHNLMLVLIAALLPCLTFAQSPSAKPMTIVVPAPAGGDTDAIARLLGSKLTARTGQTVVVDNRPGASGIIASVHVGKSPADGSTLLLSPSTFATAQLVVKGGAASYDALNGFTPVIQTGAQPLILVASADSGIRSFKDMVSASKAGRQLAYASPGAGSPMHVLGEMVNRSAGTQLQHVAYKGVAPAVNDVLGGHIPLTYITIGPVAAYLQSGKMVALAVASRQRSALLPNVPTFRELGHADIDVVAWNGLWAPKGVAPEFVSRLNAEINEILKMPDVVTGMATIGATVVGGEPEVLSRANAETYRVLGRAIKEMNIQAY